MTGPALGPGRVRCADLVGCVLETASHHRAVQTPSRTRSQPRNLEFPHDLQLLSIALICFGLGGALGPMRRPAFHGRWG